MTTFDEEAMLRQAETHARLNSLHSSCSAMWAEVADHYRDRADALMRERKNSQPAAPVDLNKWPGTAGQPDYSAMKQTVATALHEIDRVAAHDYQTPLDPPLELPKIVPCPSCGGELVHFEGCALPAAPVLDMTKPADRQMLLHLDERMTRMTASGFQGPIIIMDGELRFLHGLVTEALKKSPGR